MKIKEIPRDYKAFSFVVRISKWKRGTHDTPKPYPLTQPLSVVRSAMGYRKYAF